MSDNLSYKFVALGVAIILWMSMLGRKDSTLAKDFKLQVIVSANMELASSIPDTVKVEIVGPRVALKKINSINPVFTLDLTTARPGRQVVQLRRDGLSLPIGARVLTVEPHEFPVVLRDINLPHAGESK